MDVRSCRYRHADLLRDKISSHVCPLRNILWFYWRRKASSAWKIPKAWCFMCLDCLFKYFTSESRSKPMERLRYCPTSRIFCPRGVKHNSLADSKARAGIFADDSISTPPNGNYSDCSVDCRANGHSHIN